MLTMNDFIQMILNMPKALAAGWAAWFFFGLLLSVWGRREKSMVDDDTSYYDGANEHKSGVRAAAATKPPSGVRAPVTTEPVIPATAGDAFGELERLLEPESPTHRTPGEKQSPVLAESAPALAAPQSLP